ncbi:MAG: hypothetical protein ACI837_001657 [Crocinitomicaceae bacterium]|jgi:hypothetical protein
MKLLLPIILIFILSQGINARIDPLRSPELKVLPDSLKTKSLTELSILFNTDKSPSQHNFISIYERYFATLQDSMKKFFEIGVFNGASHKMWKCYFPNAEIYGIDIKPKPWVEQLGINISLANQGSREDLQKFVDENVADFDVILDDGSQIIEHQIIPLGFLFKPLKPGGLYIIEDVHTSIPTFYKEDFGANEDLSNTTLTMISNYILTEKINSEFLTEEEIKYLEQNIEYVELSKRKSGMHSTLCVFRKKELK